MLNNKLVTFLLVIFLPTISASHASEKPTDVPVIDSALTIERSFEGLDPNCPPEIKNNQALIDVLYYSADGLIHKGQVMMDQRLADDIRTIFEVALETRFPITSVIPLSQFDWSDEDSMSANNTSGFNYREVTGGKKLSNHAYGFAVDINPLLNPFIKNDLTLPANSVYNPEKPGTLTADHAIVKAFLKLGWEWGGNWQSLKDYQHFEKVMK
jgi:hypothetical protein